MINSPMYQMIIDAMLDHQQSLFSGDDCFSGVPDVPRDDLYEAAKDASYLILSGASAAALAESDQDQAALRTLLMEAYARGFTARANLHIPP